MRRDIRLERVNVMLSAETLDWLDESGVPSAEPQPESTMRLHTYTLLAMEGR